MNQPRVNIHQGRALPVPYKIRPGERDDQLQRQSGLCWTCKLGKELVVDHDHRTGAKRGLICQSCNLRAAWVDKNLELINERGLPPDRQDDVTQAVVEYVRSGGVWVID